MPELEDDEYEGGTVDNDPPEYLSYDGYVSDTEDIIQSQDNNRSGWKMLVVWERYNPVLEHDYSRTGYMMSVDANTYAHENLTVLYIYVNYHVIFLQVIILKII